MIVPGPENHYFKTLRGLFYGWVGALILGLYPYTEDPATPIKILLSAGALLAISLVAASGLLRNAVALRPVSAPAYLLFAWLALLSISALLSEHPARSLHALLPWVIFGTLALLAHQLFSHARHVRTLFRVVVGATALSSIYGFLQYAGMDPFPWAQVNVEEYRGLPATFGNPNVAGHTLLMAIVLAVGLLVDGWHRAQRRRAILFPTVALIILLSHLYLTHMRSGIVALLLGGLAVGLMLLLRSRKQTALFGWSVGVTTVGILLGFAATMVMFSPARLPLDTSLQLRLQGYYGASQLFLEHGLMGIGPGEYAYHNIPYWTDFEARWFALEGKRNHHVHNEWLEVGIEGGAPALFLLILLFLHGLIAPFRRPSRPSPPRFTLPVVLLVVAVDACFGFNLHVPVSGALVFIFLLLQPDGTERWTLLQRRARWAIPFVLVPLSLVYFLQALWLFQSEQHFQRGQGALAWLRTHPSDTPTGNDAVRAAARNAFQQTHVLQPWEHRPLQALAQLAREEGRLDDAVALLEKARSQHPHLPQLNLTLTRVWLEKAQQETGTMRAALLDRAQHLAHETTARCPALGEAHALLGWTYWLADRSPTGAIDNAITAFETARQHGVPANPSLEHALSLAYGAQGQWRAAETARQRSLSLAPSDSTYWEAYAALVERAPELEVNYRQLLRHVLSIETTLEDVLRGNLAHELVERSTHSPEQEISRRCLRQVANRYPDDIRLWNAWFQLVPPGDRGTALQAVQAEWDEPGKLVPTLLPIAQVAQAQPGDHRALVELTDHCAQMPGRHTPESNRKTMGALLQFVFETSEDSPHTAGYRGQLAFLLGDYESAVLLLQRAATEGTADARGEATYYLSQALAHHGKSAAALALAREALQSDPGSVACQWNFALRLAESGEGAAARFQLEALLPQLSQRPDDYAAVAQHLEALRRGVAP